MKKASLIIAAACAAMSVFAAGQKEAAYPQKAITMIIPYGAGGTTDIHGRQFAIQLQKQLGKPVTVVNQFLTQHRTDIQFCLQLNLWELSALLVFQK